MTTAFAEKQSIPSLYYPQYIISIKNQKGMQPKTRQELAWQYGYCTRTFVRMLQQHQLYLRPRVLISLKAQIRIYARLGIPPGLPEEVYIISFSFNIFS